MDAQNSIGRGDLLIREGQIVSLEAGDAPADVVIDASDCAVLPGFVQTHLHLANMLFAARLTTWH